MLRGEIDQLRDELDLAVTEVIEVPPDDSPGRRGGSTPSSWSGASRGTTATTTTSCGPPPMVIAVGRQLRERGIPTRRIHTEQFDVV